MDPNAALRRWRRAIEEKDFEESGEARMDLRQWLKQGGFEPSWGPGERAQFVKGGERLAGRDPESPHAHERNVARPHPFPILPPGTTRG